MVLIAGWIWEGLSTETRPSIQDGAQNRHLLKELDTGETYTMQNNVWVLSNSNPAAVRATKAGLVTTEKEGIVSVKYATPFIDAEYIVLVSCHALSKELISELEELKVVQPIPIAHISNITEAGFDIQSLNAKTGLTLAGVTVSWLATRKYNQ